MRIGARHDGDIVCRFYNLARARYIIGEIDTANSEDRVLKNNDISGTEAQAVVKPHAT